MTVEERLTQAEVDIKNLATAIGKLNDVVATINKGQQELLIVMSKILVKMHGS